MSVGECLSFCRIDRIKISWSYELELESGRLV